VVTRAREVLGARSILANLVRKEVKVKYKSSVLGMAWSMLNPVLYLAVFSLVFSVVLETGIPQFAIYLLSGLLAWSFFSNALNQAARSVVENSNLVTKVYFPREVLPLASVGASGVDFLLQALVLAVFMIAYRYSFVGLNLLLLPLALIALVTFTSALALSVAAFNVRYRDTQHLLGVALLAWFWLTPVVYPSGLLYSKFADVNVMGISLFDVFLVNPLVVVVLGFQRALYATTVAPDGSLILPPVSVGWLAVVLAAVTLGSALLLLLAWRGFFHMSGDFAEEL
jgi:ABC-2 type transport system permease protein